MKPACTLIFTLFVLSSFAQPFQADTFGRVKDPAFLQFIKSRNYALVEDFSIVNDKLQLKLAKAWKNGEQIYIDLKGEEFREKKDALAYYRTGKRPDLSEERNDSEVSPHILYVEEDTDTKDPLTARFDGVSKLTNEFIKARKSRLYGIYTPAGAEILPVIFSRIDYFGDAGCFVCQRPEDQRYYIYDGSGKLTTDCGFYQCTQFSKHLFRIQDSTYGNYGIWSHQTNDTVLPVIYEEINLPYFDQEFCQIALSTETAEEKIEKEEFERWRDGDEFSYLPSLKYGIIDRNGNIIIEPKYQWVQYAPKSDYFVLKLDNKYGVITPKNQQLLPFEYDQLASVEITRFNEFSFLGTSRLPENLLIFKAPGAKTGVMNITKKIVLEPIYDALVPTYNGILALREDLTGLLSIDGEIIVPFQKMKVNNVGQGKISGFINDKRCTIDFYGNVMYR